jgi:hypothetical protein
MENINNSTMNEHVWTIDDDVSHELKHIIEINEKLDARMANMHNLVMFLDNSNDIIESLFRDYECLSESDVQIKIENREHVEQKIHHIESQTRFLLCDLNEMEKYATLIIENIRKLKSNKFDATNECRRKLLGNK